MNVKEQISTTELTPKQVKYIELRTQGMGKEEAKIGAGYSPVSTTSQIEKSPALKNTLCKAMEKAGLTDGYLAKKLMQGTMAFDKHFYSYEGQVIDSRKTVDFGTREKYLRTILEVQGYLKSNSDVNLNLGVIAVSNEKQDQEWNQVEDQVAEAQIANDVPNEQDSKG